MLVTGVVISAYCLRCTTLEVVKLNVGLDLPMAVAYAFYNMDKFGRVEHP